MRPIRIDRFSAGLDDLSRKDQRDEIKVLQVLQKTKRFSVFEASENDGIARTMDSIFEQKLVERIGAAYPWTVVALTAAGFARIDAARQIQGGDKP